MIYELAKVKDATKVTNSEELAKIAEELGLEIQARRYRCRSVKDCFTPLTEDEWQIWAEHCPTRYWWRADPKHNLLIKDYAFDTIPGPVLQHWKAVRDEFAFDNFVIRTTEKTQHKDPLLLGTHGEASYLLARWGEEAPDLLPLIEVAKRVFAKSIQEAWADSSNPFRLGEAVTDMKRYIDRRPHLSAAMRVLGLPPVTKSNFLALLAMQ